MKKWLSWLLGGILLLLIATGAVWGWANHYVNTTALPPRVHLSSWLIGGMERQSFETELLNKIKKLEQTPVQFIFKGANLNPVQTTLKDLGVRYDSKPLLLALDKLFTGSLWERFQARRTFKETWALGFTWNNNIWKQRFNSAWETQTFGKPVNARREITAADQVAYTPDKKVYRLDRMQMEQLIRVAIPSDWSLDQRLTIEVPLVQASAAITLETLQNEGIERKIIEVSTFLRPGDAGRIHNVNAAAKTIDDMILKPGEVFDYDKVIAKTERLYGFKEAPVILNGKLVPGIGGGICQVSSTLYNAVLRTGLDIVERRNHSMPVAYLPLGLDATFSQGYINFKFKNTTEKNLLIRTSTEHEKMTVKLFGTMDGSITYKMETKTVKVLEPTVKYVKNSDLPIGTQETLQRGKKGYTVESYRIKMLNGKEVSRERMAIDTYRAQPTLIAINSGENGLHQAPNEQKPIVEDGVNGPNFR
ncbi:VanW family protein [Paenibacillus sp. UMB4589-SE434]|uniref:VanW family protein n=1 Tax=Paenibacillus sp. UMB4589-SE434 TaxID=3046314 RepID=UPI00254FE123|nr:VanW family protein [Paenibacillus sp. UMB4589-SE434]MDK8181654.1 VanW family protein [Paenibacillus sp. UMB4589-SE434]